LSDEDGNSKEKDLHNPDYEMGEANPEKEVGNPSVDQSQPPPQHPQNLNQKQASLFQEALDLACDKLFNEISIKVMLEPDDGTSRKIFTPLTEEELGSYNALVDSPVKIHPSSVFFPPSPETQVDVFSANSFQQNKDDVGELQLCGGILPHLGTLFRPGLPRRHPRLQGLLRPTFRRPAWHSWEALLRLLLLRLLRLHRLHLHWRLGDNLRGHPRPHRRASCLYRRRPWGPRWGDHGGGHFGRYS
jgi:hypothetical protein